jgi:hypothetical protein
MHVACSLFLCIDCSTEVNKPGTRVDETITILPSFHSSVTPLKENTFAVVLWVKCLGDNLIQVSNGP